MLIEHRLCLLLIFCVGKWFVKSYLDQAMALGLLLGTMDI